MNKKIMIWIVGILLVSVAFAQVVSNMRDVEFPVKLPGPSPGPAPSGVVYFDCGKTTMSITLSKADASKESFSDWDLYSELELPMREQCPNTKITNIRNLSGSNLITSNDCAGKSSFSSNAISNCINKSLGLVDEFDLEAE